MKWFWYSFIYKDWAFLVIQLPIANTNNEICKCKWLFCLEHLNYNWKGKDQCFGICLSKTLLPKGIDQVAYPEARLKAIKKIPKYPGSRNKRPTGQNINPPDKENDGYYVDYEEDGGEYEDGGYYENGGEYEDGGEYEEGQDKDRTKKKKKKKEKKKKKGGYDDGYNVDYEKNTEDYIKNTEDYVGNYKSIYG